MNITAPMRSVPRLRSLAYRMAAATLTFALAVALIISSVGLWRDQRSESIRIDALLNQVNSTMLDALTMSVWQYDGLLTRSIAEGIARTPDVTYVMVRNDDEVFVTHGQVPPDAIVREYALEHDHNKIGLLVIAIDMQAINKRLWATYLKNLGTNALLIVLVTVFILMLFEWQITRHLRRVADFVAGLSANRLDSHLQLDRSSRRSGVIDELDVLTQGITRMQESLAQAISELDEDISRRIKAESEVRRLNASLEERVQQRTEALRASETQLRQITNALPVLISCLDTQQRLMFHNKAYEEVLGLSFEQIHGHTLAEVIGQATYESIQDKVEEALRGHPVSHERTRATPQGDLRDYVINLLPRYGEGTDEGKVIGIVMLSIDITERKRAQDEILHLNASLEERVQQRTKELEEKAQQLALTSQYKSEFLSNMSHELRTPLNSLLILSQLLAENDENNLSEQQIKYAKIIHGSGKDLLAIISDILDLSKIESGTVTLELQDVSFANVHESVERHFRHVAESRGLGFRVELAPSLPPSLYTDSQRLQQVLKNLLSNAFKFTSKGQVSVRIAAVESGWSVAHDGLNRAGAVIGFYVTDSGIGLAADKQKIIFEAFQQADTGTTRKYGGTGLGLSISRELAWLLGGELHLVASQPGQGSTFALYLPLRVPESGGRHDAGDGRL